VPLNHLSVSLLMRTRGRYGILLYATRKSRGMN
jgi:hypothetical protein